MLQLFLGQIPEAIYCSLFIIITKQIKEKRFFYVLCNIMEYLILVNVFKYEIWFDICYVFMSFLLLKMFYKEKCQITDLFTFLISIIFMMVVSIPLYFIIWKTINNFYVYVILDRVIIFTFLFLTRNKLYKIKNLYKKLWNRNDKVKRKMKSTTFRAVNMVVFNITFYLINIILLYSIVLGRSD